MIRLGEFQVPQFSDASAAFGASIDEYPLWTDIPEIHRRERSKGTKVAGDFFFSGGSLDKHGLKLRESVDSKEFHYALKSYIGSFQPKHEHKMATCGWLIDECTESL